MSDLFHESVPDDWIDRIFAVMALCPQHIFQVLTKRAARMRDYMSGFTARGMIPERIVDAADAVLPRHDIRSTSWDFPAWPLPNLWLGVSVEDQARADERIPVLLDTPAAVRWVSAEPLLESVDLNGWVYPVVEGGSRISWVVIGGESGPGARPFNVEWARGIMEQCKTAGIPVFMKQLGTNPLFTDGGDANRYQMRTRKGDDPAKWPRDLQVREYPAQERA